MLIGNALVIGVGYAGLVYLKLDDIYLYGAIASMAVSYGLIAAT